MDYIDYGVSALRPELVAEMIPAGRKIDLSDVYHRPESGEICWRVWRSASGFTRFGSPAGLRDFEAWTVEHPAQSWARPMILLDRDGVLNALVVDPEHGTIDSPLHPDQVEMLPGVVRGPGPAHRGGLSAWPSSPTSRPGPRARPPGRTSKRPCAQCCGREASSAEAGFSVRTSAFTAARTTATAANRKPACCERPSTRQSRLRPRGLVDGRRRRHRRSGRGRRWDLRHGVPGTEEMRCLQDPGSSEACSLAIGGRTWPLHGSTCWNFGKERRHR